MKTTYLLLFLASTFIALTSFSIPTNSISKMNETECVIEKDTLNIMASHGIYLRDSANLTSNKLAKLPYATKLILLNQDTISMEITVQETKYFEIKGRMQKVKVISQIDSLNNLEGYVFDGYLTKFPVPVLNYEIKREKNDEFVYADLNYLRSNFESTKKQKVKKFNLFEKRKTFCAWEQNFDKDIRYEYSICTESGQDIEIQFANLTLREAYFFSLILYYPKEIMNQEYYIFIFDKEKNQITIEPKDGGAGCFYKITQKEKDILIKYECWGC
ncbi:hypothetical protein ACE193_13070 [Bernardetia sp. OM2101]|uniref:hypothetical protein n=1 Tax=Bernardetia sp. OM2101 TaxID=3344876 RepID=UPI0035D0FD7D